LEKIEAKLKRNLGKSDQIGQIWLDLGKIKILHPQKTFHLLWLWSRIL